MKRQNIIIALCILFMGINSISFAQDHEHEHGHEHEKETALELITSGIISYSPSEEETLFGTEIHLTYWFTPRWATGFSYSSKFDEGEVLSDLALLSSVNPTRWLTVNIGPNFAFANGELREEFRLGLYAETEFNWRVSELFHFGVLTGTVLSEETELTGGVHLGFEF